MSPGPEPSNQGEGLVGDKHDGNVGAAKGGRSDKGKDRGKRKQLDPKPGAQEKPVVKQRPTVELGPTCWGGRLDMWSDVVTCLEEDVAPRGQVSSCPSLAKALEAAVLVTAHNLDVKFVCRIQQGGAGVSVDS